MKFFPSIDIKGGKCVRLYKGDLKICKVYEDCPLDAVYKYNLDRADWLHVVDIDGAAAGAPRNMDVVAKIARNVNCHIQVGGGIRSLDTIKKYLSIGVSRVILSTLALTNFELVSRACKRYLGKVALGLDTVGEYVAISGWTRTSAIKYDQALVNLTRLRLSALIWTDVMRDGTLTGVNTIELEKIINLSKLPIIVSGGVSSLQDLKSLCINYNNSIAGVISGKAIYERVFSVEDAQRALNC
ncbi:1-(5-phosphoribosyl)-5-[(5-phosphoribosylamino)methylideneamino]imidazole-4-carboxamide isomerase [Candidatus Hodgkinia cicadicola]